MGKSLVSSIKIHKRIVYIFILTTIIAMFLVGIVLDIVLEKTTLNNWTKRQEFVTLEFAPQCDFEIQEAKRDLELLSKLAAFSELSYIDQIDRSINGIPEKTEIEKKEIFQEFLAPKGKFSSLLIFKPNGDIYLCHPFNRQLKFKRYNFADRPYYIEAIKTKKTVISDSFLAATGIPLVAMITPVIDKTGTIKSLIAGTFYLNDISRLVNKQQIGNFDKGFIVDRKGHLIAHTDTKLVTEKFRKNYINHTLVSKFLEQTKLAQTQNNISNKVTIQNCIDPIDGKTYLTSFIPLQSGWGLGLAMENETILSEIRPSVWQITTLISLIILIVGVFGALFTLWTGRRWLSSEKKYRYLFKHAPAGIYEIDFINGKFITVNEGMCLFSGYSEDEFLSMDPSDLLTEESKNEYIERLGKLTTGENLTGNVEYNIIKKDGQQLSIIINSDFIYEDGKLTGARCVAHDISELKQAQNEKIIAQTIVAEQKKLALVGQIAGKMSHDFNNILTIIMGNAELSLLDCNEAQTRKTLELIFEQTLRGKNLTKNLVAFAKDQEPKQNFFKLSKKIELVLNLLKKDLDGIDVIKEDGHGVPELLADPGMIEHALVNLVQNSIHATSLVEQPEISIKTLCQDEIIQLKIEDNGCGIPEKALDRIFEPAFTMKGNQDITNSYKPGIKGTGYGMANVKKYVEQHNGNILIDSIVGKGTKITISFPVIKNELTKKEIIAIQKKTFYFEKYILLVEDEEAVSDMQYKILNHEPCNHKVDIASNAQMAIDLFARNKYDFVSLDYVLSGELNGMYVYKHIRKTNKTIPILFVSGNLNFLESIKDLKHQDPWVEHVSKPCQNKDYVNAINELLKRT